ncbi:hypothetical protein B0T09DRAFT_134209 [Sordaria sp. MPI-SDFR-AT-0083]|nr:hypothetical protein B0T09DRAFT_134209 [Sordaria sp. MPI-SDFR-AT-0083]
MIVVVHLIPHSWYLSVLIPSHVLYLVCLCTRVRGHVSAHTFFHLSPFPPSPSLFFFPLLQISAQLGLDWENPKTWGKFAVWTAGNDMKRPSIRRRLRTLEDRTERYNEQKKSGCACPSDRLRLGPRLPLEPRLKVADGIDDLPRKQWLSPPESQTGTKRRESELAPHVLPVDVFFLTR